MKGSNSAHPTILIFFWSGRGNRTLLLQLRWESRGRRTDAVSPAAGTKPKQHSEVPTRYMLLHFVRVWIAAGNVWQGKNWVSGCLPSLWGGGGGGHFLIILEKHWIRDKNVMKGHEVIQPTNQKRRKCVHQKLHAQQTKADTVKNKFILNPVFLSNHRTEWFNSAKQ